MNNNKIHDVVIIGAGPAGISCAIQLERYGIKALQLEKAEIGGLLRNANLVENYPAIPEGITGQDLIKKFSKHIEHLNLQITYEEVLNVTFNNELFKVQTQESEFKSKTLVVASGTTPKQLALKSDNKIFYDIHELYKKDLSDKTVAILGAGDAAFDYALNLTSNSDVKKVIILNRSTTTKCLEILKQNALNNPKITYQENEEPVEFTKEVVSCKSGNKFETSYLLAAIGRESNTPFLDESIKNSKNIFLIGDVKNGNFRQTAIAAGDGIKAAMKVKKLLVKKN